KLPTEQNVETRAALAAPELAEHRRRGPREQVDVAEHAVRNRDRHLPRIRERSGDPGDRTRSGGGPPGDRIRSAGPTARKRVRGERDLVDRAAERELALRAEMEDVAAGGAGGMAEAFRQGLEPLLQR